MGVLVLDLHARRLRRVAQATLTAIGASTPRGLTADGPEVTDGKRAVLVPIIIALIPSLDEGGQDSAWERVQCDTMLTRKWRPRWGGPRS